MAKKTNYRFVYDPMKFARVVWPQYTFYREQQEIIYSVVYNDETFVPAGNKLGKDFVAGFIIVYFFCTRRPCRIITTSAKDDHLTVLWGEINRFINDAKVPMKVEDGGPLRVTHHSIEWVLEGRKCPLSYVKGMVASDATIAAMQGHHVASTDGVPRTLFVCDESSSVPNEYMTMARTWANRIYSFGNTWPCENFFKHAVKGRPGTDDRGGDIPRPTRPDQKPGDNGFWRKVIRIKAEDSPNVRFALWQQSQGIEPDNTIVVPGVKTWDEYQKNRATWDAHQQCVSLDADWYEGAEVKLFPKDWLDRAEQLADELGERRRTARGIGLDAAEGGDNTSMVAVDEYGVIDLVSKKTPDTDVIAGELLAFMIKHRVHASRVCIDRGGGGKQVADRLRKLLRDRINEADEFHPWTLGWNVRTIAFGSGVEEDPHYGSTPVTTTVEDADGRLDIVEARYAFKNRRAQMYGELSDLKNFAIPRMYPQFRQQLAPIPKSRDGEGRLFLLPKGKSKPGSKEPTLTELIGHSPDEADALVLAVHAMLHRGTRRMAGAL